MLELGKTMCKCVSLVMILVIVLVLRLVDRLVCMLDAQPRPRTLTNEGIGILTTRRMLPTTS